MARTRLQLRQLQELCSFGPMAAPNTVLVGQHSICLFTDFVFTWRGGSSSISFSRGANSFGARDLCIYRFRFHAARSVQFVYLSISFSRGAVVALVRQRSLFRRLGNVQFVYRFRFHVARAVVAPIGQRSICLSVQFVYRFRYHAMSAIRLVIDFVFTW